MTIRITIPGTPVAKGRPRLTRQGVTYTPQKTQRWEAVAKLFAVEAMQGQRLLEGALRMSVHAYFPIPQSWPRWKREQAELENVLHTGRPDGDNLLKAVGDAFNQVVFVDDAQIASMSVFKRYSGEPRTDVYVTRMEGLTPMSKLEVA